MWSRVAVGLTLGLVLQGGHADDGLQHHEAKMKMITRHYAYAGERRIHYRRAGSGPGEHPPLRHPRP